jgi:hypothetical protein
VTDQRDQDADRPGWHGFDDSWPDEGTVVCPRHLRFVPCRRCEVGEETYSSDPADIERTMRYQWGDEAADRALGIDKGEDPAG